MALSADSEGFLTGGSPAPIDGPAYGRGLAILRGIKGDTAAIRSHIGDLLKGSAVTPVRSGNGKVFTDRQVAVIAGRIGSATGKADSRTRGANGRFVGNTEKQSAISVGARDAKGKFANGGMDSGFGGGRSISNKMSDAADSLKESASAMITNTENVDPAIAASKEVADLVTPVIKPLGGLFKGLLGGSKEERAAKIVHVPWYKKILKALSARVSGGIQSAGGGLLSKIPGMSGIGGALAKGAGAISSAAPLLAKLALPISAMFSAVQSFKTSTEAYAERFGADGGTFFSDLGIRFGGVLTDLGNTLTFGVAGWIGEKLSPAILDGVEYMKKGWDESIEFAKGIWAGAKRGGAAVVDAGKKVYNGAVDKTSQGIEKAADAGKKVYNGAKNVVTGGASGNKQALVDEMNASGITNPKEQAMFMAQMDHESGGFKNLEENLNYKPERLMQMFPKKFASLEEAQATVAGGREAIGNKIYGGRMGNAADEGYKFRGRGFTQLTGKDNYAAAGKDLGLDLVGNPDLAADPANAAKISTWYWKNRNGLSAAAQGGDVAAATKKINGGLNGLDDREAKYASYLSQAQSGGFASPSSPGGAPTSGAVMASATPAQIPSPPPLLTPMTSNPAGNSPTIAITQQPGQNVGDRAIAQLATGGMGSYMGRG